MTDISIIIVNYNVFNDVVECINSIKNTVKDLSYEIIVVDNNSTERSIEKINTIYPEVKFVQNHKNSGFAFANNLAMKVSSGKYIFLVNPDIIFNENAVNVMVRFLEVNPQAGACGPVQHKPGKGIERYYTFFPSLYSRLMQEFRLYTKAPVMRYRFNEFLEKKISAGKPFQVSWVIGSCLMTRKEIFKDTGGMDEAFFLFEEETEWQYRMNAKGWKIYMVPEANVIHNHHSSASKLGVLFVNYHEFRSRIIFDLKRFKGFKSVIRRLMIISALITRLIYFKIKSFVNKDSNRKYTANLDLLKFAVSSKETIMNNRYDFDDKLKLFV